jgi:hypothetical protein
MQEEIHKFRENTAQKTEWMETKTKLMEKDLNSKLVAAETGILNSLKSHILGGIKDHIKDYAIE